MLFSIIVFLMVVLVAMFWMYQGLLSSVIMFVETLVSFMLAWQFHELLYGVAQESIGPGMGLPLSFIIIFLVSLLVQREITDRLVKKNVTIPVYFDRAGAGIVGLFTGLLLVGSALIPVQMLPIGGDIFGFDRVYEQENQRMTRKLGFLNPDGFAIWLGEALSNQRFGSDNPLARSRPDALLDLYGARDATQTEDFHFIPPKSLEVTGYWFTDRIDQVKHSLDSTKKFKREYSTEMASDSGNRILVARVVVKKSAMPKDKGNVWFRVPQFRLFGPPPPAEGVAAPVKCYLAIGATDLYSNKEQQLNTVPAEQTRRLVRFNPETNFILGESVTAPVTVKEAQEGGGEMVTGFAFDVAFEVPSDWDEKSPWYMEFKRGARFDFTGKKDLYQKEIPDDASVSLGKDGSGAVRSGTASTVGGGVRGITNVGKAIEERTGVSTLIPVPLDSSDGAVAQRSQGGKLGSGTLVYTVTEKEIPAESRITEFGGIPDDMRLVQVGLEKNFPKSMHGRALGWAANVVAQISVEDEGNQKYYAIGVYHAAVIDGKWVFEIQYLPDAEAPDQPGTLKKPSKVTSAIMQAAKPENRKMGFLFLVPPEKHLVKFFTGGRNNEFQEINITTK